MYPPDYETGDEYDTPCDKYGCGFASHDPRCSYYQSPAPIKTKAEVEAELDSPIQCMMCGRTVRFREVQDAGCCRNCAAHLMPVRIIPL